jgi:hypothetical protein
MKYTVSIVLIAVFGLAGCLSAKPMTTPSGKPGFHIDCGGGNYDWSTCYEETTKRCNGPYTVVDRIASSTTSWRELMVECRN